MDLPIIVNILILFPCSKPSADPGPIYNFTSIIILIEP